jgi:dedicator of cytokinesis protein 3
MDACRLTDVSCQRGRTVWRLAGDIRGDGAVVLLRLWDALGMPEDLSARYGAVARFGVRSVFGDAE